MNELDQAKYDILVARCAKAEADLAAEKSANEELRKRLADFNAIYIQSREARATHRCKICDAKWIQMADCWTLASAKCGACCDMKPMGDQIEAIGITAQLTEAKAQRDGLAALLREARVLLPRLAADGGGTIQPSESWSRAIMKCMHDRIDAALAKVTP